MGQLKDHQWQQIMLESQLSFARSSGPGGQKVNKTESKVELRWSLIDSQALTDSQMQRLQSQLSHQITKEGEIVIAADNFRSRERNKAEVFDRLRDMIEKNLIVPKKRKKTKPSKSAREKRLKLKQQHSDKKKGRQKVDY